MSTNAPPTKPYKGKRYWWAFTPGGSLIYETAAPTREKCIAKLLRIGAHMPYVTWANFEQRGYEILQLDMAP